MEALIRDILNRFCDQHGGGLRETQIGPGRYGGFYITLVWDGFATMQVMERQSALLTALASEIGPSVYQVVRNLHLVTYSERAEEEAIAAALPSDPSWLR
jgi:hypothetical protein